MRQLNPSKQIDISDMEKQLGVDSPKVDISDMERGLLNPKIKSRGFNPYDEEKTDAEKIKEILKSVDSSDSEKDFVVNMALKNATHDDISNAILTIQGKHPKQEGGFKYYLEDTGNGYQKPVPVANTEKPKNGNEVNSIWGTQTEAEDDTRTTDVAKKIYNVLPKIGESANDLAQVVYGAATGEELPWYQALKNSAHYISFKTGSEYDKGIIDTSKVHSFSDLLPTSDAYDFSPSSIANTATQVGQSVLQFIATRGALGSAGKGTNALLKAGNITKEAADKAIKMESYAKGFASSYMTNISEAMEAANELGVKDRSAYLTAMAVTIPISAIDMLGGGEGVINKAFEQETGQSLVKNLVQGAIKDADGKMSKQVLDELHKTATVVAETVAKKTPKSFLKTVGEESGQEVSQNVLQKASQVIHDNLVDNESSKYGTELTSPQSIAEYLNDAFGGLIGGAQGHVLSKAIKKKETDEEKSKIIMAYVSSGNENELKTQLQAATKSGEITPADLQKALFKIDNYKKYDEATKDRPLDAESKRKIFDLTFEKANVKTGIEHLEQTNVDGINDGEIKLKKDHVKEVESEVEKIWKGAEEKAEKAKEPITKAVKNINFTKTKEESVPDFNVTEMSPEEFDDLDPVDRFHAIWQATTDKGKFFKPKELEGTLEIPQGRSAKINVDGKLIDLASSDQEKEVTRDGEKTYPNQVLAQYENEPVFIRPSKAGQLKALSLYDKDNHPIKDLDGNQYFIRVSEKGYGRPKYNSEEFIHPDYLEQYKKGNEGLILVPDFETRNLGREFEGEIESPEAKEIIKKSIRNPHNSWKHGEKYIDFAERTIEAYKHWLQKAKDKSLVVTHSQVISLINQWEKQGRPENLEDLDFNALADAKVYPEEITEHNSKNGKIYLVRTSESEGHDLPEGEKKFKSRQEVGLAPEGTETALKVGQALKPLGITDIITSPLKRAKDTAVIIKKTIHGEGGKETKTKPPVKPKGDGLGEETKSIKEARKEGSEKETKQNKEVVEKNYKDVEKKTNLAQANGKDRSTQEEHGSGAEENKRISEVATTIERGIEANEGKLEGQDKRELESNIAYEYAKKNDLWIDNFTSLGTYSDSGGVENTIVVSNDSKYVYKSNNLFNANGSILQLFDQVEAHNELFPSTKYEFVGFTGTKNNIQPIFKQDFVSDSKQATPKEISAFMENSGFEKVGGENSTMFKNDEYLVSDLHPRNVLKDNNGTIYVIDAITQKRHGNKKENTIKREASGTSEIILREASKEGKFKVNNKRKGASKEQQRIKSPLHLKALAIDVFTPFDLALQYFIRKGNVSPKTIFDLYNDSHQELKHRISLIKKGALSSEAIGELLAEENEGLKFDSQDYRNAVEEVLQQFTSRSQMAQDLVVRHTEGTNYTQSEEEIIEAIKEAEKTDKQDVLENYIDKSEDLNTEEFKEVATNQDIFDKFNSKTKADLIDELREQKNDNAIHADIYQSDFKYVIHVFDNKGTIVDQKFNSHEDAIKFFNEYNKENGEKNKEKYDYGTIQNIANLPQEFIVFGKFTKNESIDEEGDIFTSDKPVDFQKSNEDQKQSAQFEKSKLEAVDKIINHLKQRNPKLKIVYDNTLKTAGAAQGNAIKINPFYAGTDTPIHEVAHIIIDSIGGLANKIVRQAVEQLKGTELWKETEVRYPELNAEGLAKEVLVEAIGREGANIFDTEIAKSNFKTLLDYIFHRIKFLFGLEKNTVKALAKRVIAGDVYNQSKQTFETKLQKPKTPKEEKPAFQKLLKKATTTLTEKDLDGHSNDELLDRFNELVSSGYYKSTKAIRDASERLGYVLFRQRKEEIENSEVAKKFEEQVANKSDLTWREVKLKALSHMSEKVPELQVLGKYFTNQVSDMQSERYSKKKKAERLGNAVMAETNKKLGLKEKTFSKGATYFNYLEKDGKLITVQEAKEQGLSEAQTNYLKFVRELITDRLELEANEDIYNKELGALKVSKGIGESFASDGFVSAFSSYLGKGFGVSDVRIEYVNPNTGNTEIDSYNNIQKQLIDYSKKGFPQKIEAMLKLLKYNFKARKQFNKGINADEKLNPLDSFKSGDFQLNPKGSLTSRFDREYSGDNYSKDFYRATMEYIDDVTHVKYMGKLLPVINGIEQLNKKGFEEHMAKPNVVKWIEDWRKMHIFKEQHVTDPYLDAALKFLRFYTSMISYAFNIPAAGVNILMGNYNTWRSETNAWRGVGHRRLYGNLKSHNIKVGAGLVNPYAVDIVKKYHIVSLDFDSNPKLFAGKLFDALAYGATRAGEFDIQSSAVLGQMTKEEYNSFEYDKDGELVVKKGVDEKKLKDKINQYKEKVSSIQGKYSEFERRNIMRGEIGKTAFQFKLWSIDWIRERLGEEYITRDNKIHKGSYRQFFLAGLKDLKTDIRAKGVKAIWENKDAMQNLRGALFVAFLLTLKYSDDDDKDNRRKTLSLENALGNVLFIFDPEQLKFTIKQPVASMGTLYKFADAFGDMLKLDAKGLKKSQKLIPYKKSVQSVEELFGSE